ncbi:MAG: deoxyribodipyrimidine photo-lyase [Hyphomicrobium sp.]
MSQRPVIVWFRNDLRVSDNAALAAAVATGDPVLALYILDDETPGVWRMGGASRWWLHMSLAALSDALKERGGALLLLRGETQHILSKLAQEVQASSVFCSRAYEPYAAALEQRLKEHFDTNGIGFRRYGGALLREPEEIRTKGGDVYKVYTPFWRALSNGLTVSAPKPAPNHIDSPPLLPKGLALEALDLLPHKPDWAGGFRTSWTPGEKGAQARLDRFLKHAMKDYTDARNLPAIEGTSRLSPHLHFGEISPRMCWYRAGQVAARLGGADKGHETFLKELAWREFSYALLVDRPDLPSAPFRSEFAQFPWKNDAAALKAWQRGLTGYPIVDAGMRELWHTGYMHNRVRMIAASFLVKDLLIPWQSGEQWFWDTLVDADLANNAASWQWVAGSGADAAPYFRIFNPVTQGEKFDPQGSYVRRYVPELSNLPDEYIHAPWTAPPSVLENAGVTLGSNYPERLVEHAFARRRALLAYENVKAPISE